MIDLEALRGRIQVLKERPTDSIATSHGDPPTTPIVPLAPIERDNLCSSVPYLLDAIEAGTAFNEDLWYGLMMKEVDRLVALDPDPHTREGYALERLTQIIKAYEQARYGKPQP